MNSITNMAIKNFPLTSMVIAFIVGLVLAGGLGAFVGVVVASGLNHFNSLTNIKIKKGASI